MAGLLRRHAAPLQCADDLAHHSATNPFPSYVFIEPNFLSSKKYGPENDEHPQPTHIDVDGASNVLYGEVLIASVFNALTGSGLWDSTLFVVLFDEHGGTYDHFPPAGDAIAPDGVVIPPGEKGYSGFTFQRYGVRVPAVVMSPWIPKGTICNDQYDHTSIIRTVCSRFLPPGTHLLARDAQARDLGSLLTATSARTDLPTLKPRTPPPFDPTKLATAPLTDFQKQLLALGLQSMQSQYPEAVAQAGTSFETHADAWRILDLFPQT